MITDMNRLLLIAKEEKIHLSGLRILFLLEVPKYSSNLCDHLDINSANLTSTLDQVRRFIKVSGQPGNMQKPWRVYSLNAAGVKFMTRLRGD